MSRDCASARQVLPWRPLGAGAASCSLAVLPLLNIQHPRRPARPDLHAGHARSCSRCACSSPRSRCRYHLLFGIAGLLSFGHALYFAAGAYGLGIVLERTDLPLWPGDRSSPSLGGTVVIALVLGAVGAAGHGHLVRDGDPRVRAGGLGADPPQPRRLTGGEEGLRLDTEHVPDVARRRRQHPQPLLVRARRARGRLPRGAVGRTLARSATSPRATRENELRVRVLGLRPYAAKLIVFVIGGRARRLAASSTCCCSPAPCPAPSSADFTLTMLVMVVLGGVGFRWGAIVGGVLYTLLDQRLTAARRLRRGRGPARRAAHPAVGAAVPPRRAVRPRGDVRARRHRRDRGEAAGREVARAAARAVLETADSGA